MGLKYSAILASALLVCLGASHSQALTIAPLHQAADESPMIELVGGNGGSWSHGGGGGHGGMHGAGGAAYDASCMGHSRPRLERRHAWTWQWRWRAPEQKPRGIVAALKKNTGPSA